MAKKATGASCCSTGAILQKLTGALGPSKAFFVEEESQLPRKLDVRR